jgi:hypothetical protein
VYQEKPLSYWVTRIGRIEEFDGAPEDTAHQTRPSSSLRFGPFPFGLTFFLFPLSLSSGFGQRHAGVPKVAHARAAYLHIRDLGGPVSRELKGDSPVFGIKTICTRGQ